MDWAAIVPQIEDHMFSQLGLSVWERSLYYHLLRHTRAAGKQQALVGVDSLSQALRISTTKTRETIRSLAVKNCIRIEERNKRGHLVRVLLPEEIEGLTLHGNEPQAVSNIEVIDFYKERRYLPALLRREGGRCFYTLRAVTESSCVLDHVVPLADGGDNTYRNIVVASHEANAMKQGNAADAFLRQLYRKGILSTPELEDRLKALDLLKAGELRPEI